METRVKGFIKRCSSDGYHVELDSGAIICIPYCQVGNSYAARAEIEFELKDGIALNVTLIDDNCHLYN